MIKEKIKKKKPWQHFIAALKKITVFEGRASLAEYWWFMIFYWPIAVVVFFAMSSLYWSLLSSGSSTTFYRFLRLVLTLPTISALDRRMHDVGKSGWHVFIPIYGPIQLLRPGTIGPNKFGPDNQIEHHQTGVDPKTLFCNRCKVQLASGLIFCEICGAPGEASLLKAERRKLLRAIAIILGLWCLPIVFALITFVM